MTINITSIPAKAFVHFLIALLSLAAVAVSARPGHSQDELLAGAPVAEINSEGVNFSTLLSQYRIEEARRRLSSPEYANVTIQAIAVDLGFKSRSNFATVFKKFTGTTPNEYQKEALGKKAAD